MTEIKFDSLTALDSRAFAKASPADYPNGRYSATILRVDPVTQDSKGNFCLRIRVNIGVDKHAGKPNLFVSDQVTFTTRTESGSYDLSWAAINSFCDLAALAGADRPTVYASFKTLAKMFRDGDKSGIRDSFIAICEVAKMLPGTRVAPNIVWTEDGQYANVRGSKAAPSYISAANEIDPGASFTADDTDDAPVAPNRRRNLARVSRK